ncbi:unnamed protein product [Fraxinus pennsylvanica]|uniref:Uncharacterized protein n=1 Tax=Fraxinus pennsylvanica TaxID=56036 RepID=A0AAD2E6D7_9LAMI|nr:unnamed protein product [Fraxinus pennsylvanica]
MSMHRGYNCDSKVGFDWKCATKYSCNAEYKINSVPPCFSIYMCGLVFEELIAQVSSGKECEALMNVPLTLAKLELEAKFGKETVKEKMVQLRRHRSIGDMRASVYNAMPLAGVKRREQLVMVWGGVDFYLFI